MIIHKNHKCNKYKGIVRTTDDIHFYFEFMEMVSFVESIYSTSVAYIQLL